MGIGPKDEGIVARTSGGRADDDMLPQGSDAAWDYAAGFSGSGLSREDREAIREYDRQQREEAKRRKVQPAPRPEDHAKK